MFDFISRQLYLMNLCQKAINKQEIISSEVQLQKSSKFSLKQGKFKNIQKPSSLTKRSWNNDNGSNRFVSFMQKHNNGLAKKCNLANQIKLQTQSLALNCFDLNCHKDNNQPFLSALKMKHHPTNSTMSSSKVSEVGNYQPNYQEYQKKFKINTKSILQQLIKEGYCSTERKRMSSQYDTSSSKVSLKDKREGSFVYDWQNTSQVYSESKYQKISLKKRNPHLTEEQLNKKESLSYQQLSSPLGLGHQFEQSGQSNLATSVIIEEYPSFSYQKNDPSLDYECSQPCKWINKWVSESDTREINKLRRVNVDEKTLIQIDKDTPRTQKHPLFSTEFYRQHLRDVLVCYSSLRPEIGYVQGMNFVASTLVYHTKEFNKSSKVFNCLMMEKNFQEIYKDDFSLLTQLSNHLLVELKRYSPSLFTKINQCEIELEVFSRGWYLSMLGSFVPLKFMHLVIDKFLRKSFKGLNQLLLTILLYLKQQLMWVDDDQLATRLSNSWLSQRSKNINWQQLLGSSQNILMRQILF